MWVRLSAFVVWALVAGAVVHWALRLLASAPSAPVHTVAVSSAVTAQGDLTRLFGAPPVAAAAAVSDPEVSSRFQLLGVMAPKGEGKGGDVGSGVALIAVDGKPAKAFVVGSSLDANLVLQSVGLRTASIGPAQGDAAVTLEIPPLPAPATGTLPPPGAPGVAAPVPSRPVPPPPVATTPTLPPVVTAAPPGAIAPGLPQGGAPIVQDPALASPNLVPAPPGGLPPRRESGPLNR